LKTLFLVARLCHWLSRSDAGGIDGSPRAIARGSAIVKVTGARSRRSINMQLSPPPGPRSLAMRRLVTEIRTPPPYSSPKTINEVLEVNTRPFRHGAFALHVPVTRYHPRVLSSLSLDRLLNSSYRFARASNLEICMYKFHLL